MDQLTPAFIELNLEVKTKTQAISTLINKLDQMNCLSDKEEYLKSVIEREKILSTYCGHHIAIPHAVSKSVKKASFGFCRTKPIEWDKNDERVQFILILAIPDTSDNEDNQHIDMMSQIASLALEDEVRKIWEEATTQEQIAKTFY